MCVAYCPFCRISELAGGETPDRFPTASAIVPRTPNLFRSRGEGTARRMAILVRGTDDAGIVVGLGKAFARYRLLLCQLAHAILLVSLEDASAVVLPMPPSLSALRLAVVRQNLAARIVVMISAEVWKLLPSRLTA